MFHFGAVEQITNVNQKKNVVQKRQNRKLIKLKVLMKIGKF